MKNLIFLAAALLPIQIIVASCNRIASVETPALPDGEDCGKVRFSLDLGTAPTRASDANAQGKEAYVGDVQILVFDQSTSLAAYVDAGTSLTKEIDLKAGTYKAYAVANGPDLSTVKTESALKAVSIPLADWNSPKSAFVMEGSSSTIELARGETSDCPISVSRFVTRVKLASVKNSCPEAFGAIRLKRAYLSNVVCNQDLTGAAVPSSYSNRYGRSSLSDKNSLIDGDSYAAVPADLTFKDFSSASVSTGASYTDASWYYSYPNPAEDSVKEWSSSWTPTATRLVLVATVNGKDWYYPVAVPQSLRNCSYDVSLVITGEGLEEPQGDITELSEKGSLSVSVTINGWVASTEYKLEY